MKKVKVQKPLISAVVKNELKYYYNVLSQRFPNETISKDRVYEFALEALAQRKFIQIIGRGHPAPDFMCDEFARLLKRVRNKPIWVIGPRWPAYEGLHTHVWFEVRKNKLEWTNWRWPYVTKRRAWLREQKRSQEAPEQSGVRNGSLLM